MTRASEGLISVEGMGCPYSKGIVLQSCDNRCYNHFLAIDKCLASSLVFLLPPPTTYNEITKDVCTRRRRRLLVRINSIRPAGRPELTLCIPFNPSVLPILHSFSLTTFSPSGKLVQIEHALAAVSGGQTSLGIKG
jgi:hypothetical protein